MSMDNEDFTVGTICGGGGGFDAGVVMAGATPIWAIEYNPRIADVYRMNFGNHVLTTDVTKINVQAYIDLCLLLIPTAIHASPPCPRFSVAKAKKKVADMTLLEYITYYIIEGNRSEGLEDREIAKKVREFIRVMRPEFFSLENVWGYRKSLSFLGIMYELEELGYSVGVWHTNSADYGVAQTRTRLILCAYRDGTAVAAPEDTHAKVPVNNLLGMKDKWIGWYEAVRDLEVSFPNDDFAPWQLKRLPDDIHTHFLSHTQANSNTDGRWGEEPSTTLAPAKMPNRAILVEGAAAGNRPPLLRRDDEPGFSLVANGGGRVHRAVLVPGSNSNSFSIREGDEPARTIGDINRTGNMPRALLVDSAGCPDREGIQRAVTREENEPANTIIANHAVRPMRAVLMDAGNVHSNGQTKYREGDEPAKTVTASDKAHRAFVVDSHNGNNFDGVGSLATRDGDDPFNTVKASGRATSKAHMNGRVCRITPRALARIQSFPDWYALPTTTLSSRKVKLFLGTPNMPINNPHVLEWLYTDDGLATTIIGNAVPCLLARAIIESFMRARS